MDEDIKIPSIYRLVTESFKDLGVSDPGTVSHTILLHSRSFAGETFECEGIRAILPLDGKRLVFFGRNGEILKRVNVAQEMPEAAAGRYAGVGSATVIAGRIGKPAATARKVRRSAPPASRVA